MTEVTSRTVNLRTSVNGGDKKALSVRRYEAKPPENLELVSGIIICHRFVVKNTEIEY